MQGLKTHWARLQPRERRGVALAALLCAVLLVWGVLLAPALRSLRQVPAQRSALEAELAHMQSLQQQARALQQRPTLAPQEAISALQKSIVPLGAGAKLSVLGEQATLNLQNISAQALSQWLAQPRPMQPVELHLQRSNSATPAWDGRLVFQLPSGQAR